MEDDKGGKKNSPDEVEVLRKKVARPSSKPDPNIVELNVGGMLFTTTLSTLTKDPSSMLFSMFSGKWKTVTKNDAVFIDRDGTHFRYILNFLRDGSCELPDNTHTLRELLREAIYYQLNGLIESIAAKLRATAEDKSEKPKRPKRYHVRCLGQSGLTTKKLNQMAEDGYRIKTICVDSNKGLIYAVGSTTEPEKAQAIEGVDWF